MNASILAELSSNGEPYGLEGPLPPTWGMNERDPQDWPIGNVAHMLGKLDDQYESFFAHCRSCEAQKAKAAAAKIAGDLEAYAGCQRMAQYHADKAGFIYDLLYSIGYYPSKPAVWMRDEK